jgi:DnaJ-class molecular chaperone
MVLFFLLQVRSAYRTLAAKFHPDRQSAEELKAAEEEFKRVCAVVTYTVILRSLDYSNFV